MSVGISELLGKKHSIQSAERTFSLVQGALREGNLRLAVSRGITVVIQATAAAMRPAPAAVVRRAEELIQLTRDIVHGAVIRHAAMSGLGARKSRIDRRLEKFIEKGAKAFVRSVEKASERAAKIEEENIELERQIEAAKQGIVLPPKPKTPKPVEVPFVVERFPEARSEAGRLISYEGARIPTPTDPYGMELRNLIQRHVGQAFLKNIVPYGEGEGIEVYGPQAKRNVLKMMNFLYQTHPWLAGIFIPTPGDPGGRLLMSALSTKVEPLIMMKIKSFPKGIKVQGPEAMEVVTKAMDEIREGSSWTKFPVLGDYVLPIGSGLKLAEIRV